MAEYIDRAIAISKFSFYQGERIPETDVDGFPNTITFMNVKSVIRGIPAADVAPVVHAKWINLPKYKSVGGTFQKAQICSACNAFYVSDANTPFSNHRYCADCGAKMDLER